jgi:hypothetical protein
MYTLPKYITVKDLVDVCNKKGILTENMFLTTPSGDRAVELEGPFRANASFEEGAYEISLIDEASV